MVRLSAMLALLVLASTVVAGDDAQAKKKAPDLAAEFKKLDANSDGKLTKEEFKKFVPANKKAAASFDADKVFARVDANKDDALTEDEFKKAAARGPDLTAEFTKLDADKNKKLSKEEFGKFVPPNKKLAASFKADETFTKIDADKDSSLSPKEFRTVMKTLRQPKQ